MSDKPQPERDLKDLDSRLKTARGQDPQDPLKKGGDEPPASALGLAFRIGVELVSAIAVGLGVGWLLDQWLGTRPWLMLVFILIGGGAGILNVYRYARGFGYSVGYQQRSGTDRAGKNDETDEDQKT